MLFNSFEFLAFFSICFLIYWAARTWDARKNVLLVASYLFYGAWYPPYVLLLLFTSFLDYGIAQAIAASRSARKRLALVVVSATISLGLLAFFKYTPFLFEFFTGRSFIAPATEFHFFRDLIVPIGLSFYTFQSIGYVIDVYRGAPPVRSIRDYFLFVSFFPQLAAGPILRSSVFVPQIAAAQKITGEGLAIAKRHLILGFFQKVVLADNIAPLVNAVFGAHSAYTAADHWVAVYGFAFQIYFDFAGYSNIAIGLAAAFGFRIPQNFNNPYLAQGFREFWSRWHMSLSTWLRDYLYISLGGNRHGGLRAALNLMLTMLLGGLWHGANWTFVIWGGLHGFYLMAERAFRGRALAGAGGLSIFVRLVLTFHLTCLAWVFFRSESVGSAISFLGAMLLPGELRFTPAIEERLVYVAAALAYLAAGWLMTSTRREPRVEGWLREICDGAMFAAIVLFPGNPNAFIYFQF